METKTGIEAKSPGTAAAQPAKMHNAEKTRKCGTRAIHLENYL